MQDKAEKKTDCELVDGLLCGDESCFLEIIQRYTHKVYNLAIRITRNVEDAEEILQDVFVTVYRKLDRFEGKSAFSSWLYRITVNTAFMKLRKRKQSAAISLEDVSANIKETWVGRRSEEADVDFISSRHELRALLEEAISKLPEEYRLIFIMRDMDGLSNQEVGEILDLSVPAVKSRLHRSRLMLRKRLQRYYEDYISDEIMPVGNAATETTELTRF